MLPECKPHQNVIIQRNTVNPTSLKGPVKNIGSSVLSDKAAMVNLTFFAKFQILTRLIRHLRS